MRGSRGLSIAGCAVLLGLSCSAAAQESFPAATALPLPPAPQQGTKIHLVAPACTGVPFDRTRLVELLRVELRPLGVTDITGGSELPGAAPPAPVDDGAAAVVLIAPFACDEVAEVALTIADRATRKTVTRRLNVSDVDAAGRPRVIAIAIAELLGASWVEFALAASPAAPSSVPENAQRVLASKLVPALSARGIQTDRSALPQANAAERPEPGGAGASALRWRVDVSAITRLFPSRSTAVIGGALGLSYALSPWIRVHLGGELVFGEAAVSVGSISTNAATGSIGIGFATQGATELEVEPHLILGAGWAKGHSDDARVDSMTYTDALGIAAVSGTLRVHAGRITPLVGIDLGHTFRSISFLVDGARAAGFGGVMFGARIGCGLDF